MKEYCRQNDIATKASHRNVIERDTAEHVDRVKASAKIVEDEIRAGAEQNINEMAVVLEGYSSKSAHFISVLIQMDLRNLRLQTPEE